MKPFSLEQLGSKLLSSSQNGALADENWKEILQENGNVAWEYVTGPRGAGVLLARTVGAIRQCLSFPLKRTSRPTVLEIYFPSSSFLHSRPEGAVRLRVSHQGNQIHAVDWCTYTDPAVRIAAQTQNTSLVGMRGRMESLYMLLFSGTSTVPLNLVPEKPYWGSRRVQRN